MSIIEVKNISYGYNKGDGKSVRALNDITFSIEEGEFVTVIGENGSGKSTLAKLLNGLFTPDFGSITINGCDTSNDKTIFEVRKTAGMVFQNPDNQMVATIVEDDVAFGPENIGVESGEIKRRVEWALSTVGMSDFANRPSSKLSGGQKQRVAIAGVLALKPKILILDEATSMLDPIGRQEVLDVAKKLNNEGITIVLITHNMDEVILSNRTLVLKDGSLLFDGAPRELFLKNDIVRHASLTLPPVARLCDLLNRGGLSIRKDLLFYDEFAEELCSRLK